MIVWQDDIIHGCTTIEQVKWFFRFGSFDGQQELIIAIDMYLLSAADRVIMKDYGFGIVDILNSRIYEMPYTPHTKEFVCKFAEAILRRWNLVLGYDYFGRPPRYPHRRGSHLPDHLQD